MANLFLKSTYNPSTCLKAAAEAEAEISAVAMPVKPELDDICRREPATGSGTTTWSLTKRNASAKKPKASSTDACRGERPEGFKGKDHTTILGETKWLRTFIDVETTPSMPPTAEKLLDPLPEYLELFLMFHWHVAHFFHLFEYCQCSV